MRQRTADLCVFAFAVSAPTGLIVLGLPSDQVIPAMTATALLYSTWRQSGGGDPPLGSGRAGGAEAGPDPAPDPGDRPEAGLVGSSGQGRLRDPAREEAQRRSVRDHP